MRKLSCFTKWVGGGLLLLAGWGGSLAANAVGAGSLSLSRSYFLAESPIEYKSNEYSRFNGNFDFSGEIFDLQFGLDFRANSLVGEEDADSFIAIPEAFVKMSSGDQIFSFSLGRMKHHWSSMDEDWALGVWQPMVGQGEVFAEQQGLVGAFAEINVKKFHLMGFFSGLYFPNQTGNVEVADGKIVAQDRWYQDPVTEVEFANVNSDVHYEINEVDRNRLLSQWSYGIQIGLGEVKKEGWLLASFASKPMNQLYLGIEGSQDISGNEYGLPTLVTLHADVARHNVASLELGSGNEEQEFWVSVIYDTPLSPDMDQRLEKPPLNSYTLVGFNYERFVSVFNISGFTRVSFLTRFDEASTGANDSLVSEKRWASYHPIPFKEVWRFGWRSGEGSLDQFSYGFDFVYSPVTKGSLLISEFSYKANTSWRIFSRIDVVGSDSDEEGEFFYRNQGNDRIVAGVTYVF